jgi:hypothetical protein
MLYLGLRLVPWDGFIYRLVPYTALFTVYDRIKSRTHTTHISLIESRECMASLVMNVESVLTHELEL